MAAYVKGIIICKTRNENEESPTFLFIDFSQF